MIDGVADPVSWFTGRPPNGASIPVFTRIGSAHGAEDSLKQFTNLCDAAGPAVLSARTPLRGRSSTASEPGCAKARSCSVLTRSPTTGTSTPSSMGST